MLIHQNNRKLSGLTIIEMIVTIAIFVVIIVVLVSSVIIFYRGNGFAVEQAFAIDSARRGVEFMVRDIREATYADDGAYPIISMSSTTLFFYSDIDRDNNVERVRFSLDNSIFYKAVANSSGNPLSYENSVEATSTLSDNVRNILNSTPIFQYFDEQGTEITNYNNVADVVFVRTSIIVNVNPERLPNEFTLRSSATLRNLRPNQ